MLTVIVRVRVKPGFEGPFTEATLENARRSVLEPGIARFDVLRQRDDPCSFVLIETYRTADAPATHKSTSHYARWRDAVEPMMAEPRAGTRFDQLEG